MAEAVYFDKGKKTGPRPNGRCPWGCHPGNPEQCNRRGYCKHLVGFTIDKMTMEIREKLTRFDEPDKLTGDGDLEVTRSKVAIDESDIIVDMATPTCRVYRQDGNAPYMPGKFMEGPNRRKPRFTAAEALADQNERLQRELAEARAETERLKKESAEPKKKQPATA